MPYLQRSAGQLVAFIRSRQPLYNWRLDRVWMQHLDIADRCSYFVQRRVVAGPCDLHPPFLCEMGETSICPSSAIWVRLPSVLPLRDG